MMEESLAVLCRLVVLARALGRLLRATVLAGELDEGA